MTRLTMIDANLLPGERRLLHDLAAVARVLDTDRLSARERLANELGAGFADLLRSSLVETTARAA